MNPIVNLKLLDEIFFFYQININILIYYKILTSNLKHFN